VQRSQIAMPRLITDGSIVLLPYGTSPLELGAQRSGRLRLINPAGSWVWTETRGATTGRTTTPLQPAPVPAFRPSRNPHPSRYVRRMYWSASGQSTAFMFSASQVIFRPVRNATTPSMLCSISRPT